MNRQSLIYLLICFLVACSPTPTVPPSTPITNSNPTAIIPVSPLPEATIPPTVIQPTPTNISLPEPAGAIWLQILSPLDEAVVSAPQVDVIGSAPAGSVVSVNEEILLVGDDQQFHTVVLLEEGPNLIEIIASDENGNETSALLVVTYEP
ncbi:MAG TPA: hypothetical protein VFR47_12215 [Anaerolineales bacterium]|nr:hypothetical protein [Anaerolineales bacterium]